MISDDTKLNDGTTFDEYHRDDVYDYRGFQKNTKGSQFDNFIKFVDSVTFRKRQDLDEVYNAHMIDYAHDLELDDFGDDLNIPRGNLDDVTYRFLLKSRLMSRNSAGTLNDLIRIAANLLGCNESDVYMTRDRHYEGDQLVGDTNTLKIVDIPYNKVKNLFVLDRLVTELEKAANGDTTFKFVDFSIPIALDTYVGMGMQSHAEMDLSIPPYVEVKQPMSMAVSTGVGLKLDYYVQI